MLPAEIIGMSLPKHIVKLLQYVTRDVSDCAPTATTRFMGMMMSSTKPRSSAVLVAINPSMPYRTRHSAMPGMALSF